MNQNSVACLPNRFIMRRDLNVSYPLATASRKFLLQRRMKGPASQTTGALNLHQLSTSSGTSLRLV
jgi:hypothetical protein